MLEGPGGVSAHDTFPSDVLVNDLVEDSGHDVLVEIGARDDVEVTTEARSHRVFTASRWAHCTDQNNVRDLDERVLIVRVIVPLAMVNPLSEELNGRLCSLFLHSGHVEVVDEDCHPLVVGRTQVPALPQHELLLNLLLGVVGRGLRAEANGKGIELVFLELFEELGHCDSLASARRAHKQDGLVCRDEHPQNVLLLHSLSGWDNDFVLGEALLLSGEHVAISAVQHIFPAEPEDAIHVEVGRRQALVWDLRGALDAELFVVYFVYLANVLFQKSKELAYVTILNDGTHGPHDSVLENHVKSLGDFVLLDRRIVESFNVGLFVRHDSHYAQHALRDLVLARRHDELAFLDHVCEQRQENELKEFDHTLW